MTRELKLALIVGFVVVILVTVLISDHLSQANTTKLATSDVQAPALIQPTETRNSESRPDPVFAGRVPPSPGPLMETPKTTPGPVVARGEVGDQGAPRVMRLTQGENSNLEEVVRELGGTIRDGVIGLPLTEVHTMDGAGGTVPGREVAQESPKVGGSNDTTVVKPVVKPVGTLISEPQIDLKPVVKPEPKNAVEPLVFHTVAEGDSLYKIAKQYLGNGNEYRKIIAANPGLTEGSPIRPGQKLRIPAKATELVSKAGTTLESTPRGNESAAKTAPVKPSPAKATKSVTPERYTVKAGDTISHIAQSVLGSVRYADAILDANPDVDAETMAVGTVLKIPAVK